MRRFAFVVALGALLAVAPARAEGPAAPAAPVLVDRVVVRWSAPELGGAARPQFIFERELAFEARLEALIDPDADPGPYHERHVRAALDRHIAETLLASLPAPPLVDAALAARTDEARVVLEQRVHGRENLIKAATVEGLGAGELTAFFRRAAKASHYLDRMVAPMLEPSPVELRELHRVGATPFKDEPFDKVEHELVRWYVGQRLSEAVQTYYQNARARVTIVMVSKPR